MKYSTVPESIAFGTFFGETTKRLSILRKIQKNILNDKFLYQFQICQLSFFHSAALEALAQQRRHNNAFFCLPPGSYPSPAIASIEHLLWKGKQVCLYIS